MSSWTKKYVLSLPEISCEWKSDLLTPGKLTNYIHNNLSAITESKVPITNRK